jgi:tRNA-specific 2-thiouridylase
LADARAAAARIDIPFKVFDFQAEYKQHVVDVMVAEYQAGRTPNPDVLCNQEIKFHLFLQAALADGADFIATGHYAGTKDGRLLMATDTAKDQTYFLYRVTTEALKRTLFPLAGLTKPEVRRIAAELGLPTAKKPDSQGICFVGEVGLREFLRQYLEVVPGPIVDRATGRLLGEHQGAVFYTIGQRQGLGIGGGAPYYVTGKDMATGTVYVTTDPVDPDLATDRLTITQTNWIGAAPTPGRTYRLRSRHRAELISCTVTGGPERYEVQLEHPERAITPGQSAVLYDGPTVLGGGIVA